VSVSRLLRTLQEHRLLIGLAAPIAVLGWRAGGFLPRDWGALALAGALATFAALMLRREWCSSTTGVAWVSCFLGLAGWQLVSILWSPGAHGPVTDAELTLVYGIVAAAIIAWARRRDALMLVYGVALGCLVVTLGGLGRHLLPTVFADQPTRMMDVRLTGPMGYANSAGILAGIGLILMVGIATQAPRAARTAAAVMSVPFGLVLYLSFSRGATLATIVGFLVLLAFDRHRRETVLSASFIAVPVALAILLAGRHPGVVEPSAWETVVADGRRLSVWLVPVSLLAAGAGFLRARVPRLVPMRRRLAAALTISGIAVVLIAGLGATIRAGGPVDLVQRAVDAFRSAPTDSKGDPRGRLFETSDSVRSAYWRVAGRMVAREPALGEGAGSFERWWTQERPIEYGTKNAHNLYLEMLAEVGPVGLGLVLLLIGLPLASVRRARYDPVGATAFAGFATIAAHAAVDWEWEVPLTMIAGLGLAAATIVAAAPAAERRLSGRTRVVGAGVCVAAVVAAVVMQAGNRALVDAEIGLYSSSPSSSVGRARTAQRWMPWSAVPWIVLGEAQTASGRVAAARSSLQRAVRLDPESWRAWLDLAVVSSGADLERALDRASALNPLSSEIALLREQ
jgi:O-Antigen ligase